VAVAERDEDQPRVTLDSDEAAGLVSLEILGASGHGTSDRGGAVARVGPPRKRAWEG